MKKRRIIRFGVLALTIFIAYFVISPSMNTSIILENFPLEEKWSARLNENIEQISIADNQIVLARTASGIDVLDLKTGKILWHRDTGWLATNQPAMAKNNFVFLTEKRWLWALNQTDGRILWQQPVLSPESAEVVDISSDLVVVFDTQQLLVYRIIDGTLLLRKSVCRNSYLAHLDDARLYYPCSGIMAVDINSDTTMWEIKSGSAIAAAAYADGVLYSDSSIDLITAFNLEEKKQIWGVPLISGRVQELKVADEFLFMTDRKQFCVLQRATGKISWCAVGAINQQNPAKVGDIAYIFNGPQNVITAFDVYSGTKLGQLKIRNLQLFTIFRQLMVGSKDLLIFASGNEVFAFGK